MSTKHPDSDEAPNEGPPEQSTANHQADPPKTPVLTRLRGSLACHEPVGPEAHTEWLARKFGL